MEPSNAEPATEKIEGRGREETEDSCESDEPLHESVIYKKNYDIEEVSLDSSDSNSSEKVETREGEPTVVDLRTTKESGELDETTPPNSVSRSNKCRRNISSDQLLERDCYNAYNPYCGQQSKIAFNNPFYYNRSQFIMYNTTPEGNYKMPTDYSTSKSSGGQELISETKECLSNKDPIQTADQGSQTLFLEMKDASVQTDTFSVPALPTFPVPKNPKTATIKYSCSSCKHPFMTKTSYDRHLRTHTTTSDSLTCVRFTTEAKLQVYKRQEAAAPPGRFRPLVIQMPSVQEHKCLLCPAVFRSRRELNAHECQPDLLPLTKCPECPVKFYTSGALKDHVKRAHGTQEDSSYFCIFCDESFESGYSFHLHLDQHLTN